MEDLNLIILLVLAISPFIYIPYIVPKNKRRANSLVWFIITFLLGLVKCMCYHDNPFFTWNNLMI